MNTQHRGRHRHLQCHQVNVSIALSHSTPTPPHPTVRNNRDSVAAKSKGNAPPTSTDQAHLTQTRVQRNADGSRAIVIL